MYYIYEEMINVNVLYCDKCEREISAWDNEYGQVMSVKVTIDGGNSNEICDKSAIFCSSTCAIKYLMDYKKIEDEWLDAWRRGKILGVAPVKSKKVNRE
jgi:hypothetical protein